MAIKGDFLSFKFGDWDCADLGIVRTSDGDRIEEQLQPEIKDITAEVPGMHGEYYFGSTYGSKPITVSFAFDEMTEIQFRRMRQVFAWGQMQKLIFSERPYKYYQAKIESPIELSYVCFERPKQVLTEVEGIPYNDGNTYSTTHQVWRDGSGTERIYKGEGTIEFICYFPFAKSCYKALPEVTTAEKDPYSDDYNPYVANIDEWAESSGMLTKEKRLDPQINVDNYIPRDESEISPEKKAEEEAKGIFNVGFLKLYNPGDIETGVRIYCPFKTLVTSATINEETGEEVPATYREHSYSNGLTLIYRYNDNYLHSNEEAVWRELARLTFKPITTPLNELEKGFIIDTNTGLITGVITEPLEDINGNVEYKTDGILYNQFIENGQFFKIQPNDYQYTYQTMIAVVNGNEDIQIFYDYLYF